MDTDYFLSKTLSAEIRGDHLEAIAWRISYMKHALQVEHVKKKHRKRAYDTIDNLVKQQILGE